MTTKISTQTTIAKKRLGNPFDEVATQMLEDVKNGTHEFSRPAVKFPYIVNVAVKQITARKRQTVQSYVLALVLEDLERKQISSGLRDELLAGYSHLLGIRR